MDATASPAAKVSQQVLANLVEQFDVDAAFLRHTDHNVRASKLIADLIAE
jgi:diguanylate cyclase